MGQGDPIPPERVRGSAGVVLHNDKFYVFAGIVNGHIDGWVPWTDKYDPKTGKWRILPDAPRPRDHFQAAVVDDKVIAVAGRRSSQAASQAFHFTIKEVGVFNIKTETWSTLPSPEMDLPTARAGNSVFSYHGLLLVAGGETERKSPAHNEVEVLDIRKQKWMVWPGLAIGRHGTGIGMSGDFIYTCSGSGSHRGSPELVSTERFDLDLKTHDQDCCNG